jgi:hypothetical protein
MNPLLASTLEYNDYLRHVVEEAADVGIAGVPHRSPSLRGHESYRKSFEAFDKFQSMEVL